MLRRIFLFLCVNALVVFTISFLLHFFNVQPYLNAYGIDYTSLMIFCGLWGMGGALISLALSKTMAKWLMRVQIIDPNTDNQQLANLYHITEKLARQAGLKAVPEVGIFSSNAPNAFATGPSQRKSLVAISTGLIDKLSLEEIEAVIGHEISHIANGDMVTMTLLQGVVNAFVMFLARVLAFFFSGFGKDRDSRSSGGSWMSYYLFTFLFEVVFMIFGSMVVAAFSRYREFHADKGSADLLGKEPMIQALKKLEAKETEERIFARNTSNNGAIQALMISRPSKTGFLHLFATHPSIQERVARLERGY